MDRQQTFRQAKAAIDARWQQAQYDLDSRLSDLYAKHPQLKKINSDIEKNMFLLMKEIIVEGEEKTRGQTDNTNLIKARQTDLLQKRNSLLHSLDITESYLKPIYYCKLCDDSGFIADKRCACLEKALIELAYHHANLETQFEEENFDTFKISYYSQEKDENYGISPYDNMLSNLAMARNFAKDFQGRENHLLLTGDTGLGKTFLCNAIAKEVLDQGMVVFYTTAGHLFSAIEKMRFSTVEEKRKMEDLHLLALSADLLIIDDLGTEFSTTVTRSAFFTILNDRIIYNKPMIISTNLSMEAIRDGYTDRITSRMVGSFTQLRFFGEDIRVKMKYNL